ncbi:MAG TPA: tetratricopeptide repeat protein, partial [Candidatus Omnitrophota bacterium]|nr:tetratricopeptide repeat protein [Candidatus Omnitrophota bacterium]
MAFKRKVIYISIALFCLCPANSYGEDLSVEKTIPIITDIEQTVGPIVLSDHDKAVQYARNGDLISAYSYIQKAYHEYPEDPGILADYIAISAWAEKYEESLAVYDQNSGADLPDSVLKEIIKALKEVGRYADAIDLSKDVLQKDPTDIDVKINLIYALVQTGDLASAQNLLSKAVEDHSDALRLQSLQALLYASQKQWKGFFDAIEQIKKEAGDSLPADILSDMNEGFYLVYDEAIAFARQDQFNEALGLLDRLEVFENKSQQIAMDRIVIYIWQENFEQAVSDYQQMNIDQDPAPYFLKEVARAYKRCDKEIALPEKHWQYIAPYVEAIEEQEYANRVQLAFIRSNMEEGDTEKALSLIDEVLKADPQQQEAMFLKAEIYDATGEYWKAVKVYDQILKIFPDNRAAFNLKLRSLMDLGATSIVLREAEQHPDIVDAVVVERARTNVPMHEIRWEESKLALQKIDQFQEEYERASSENPEDEKVSENYQRVQWDRFLALRQEEKMREIVDAYEALVREGTEVPPWVERSAADAYLYLEKPEEALEIFNRLAQTDPSFDVQMSVYYTLVDLGRFKEAQEKLDRIDQVTPEKIIERGILQDNWQKADIAFNKAWLLMYQDRLREAEKYIKDVKKVSPFNTDLRTAEAHNHLYRGWKRRALEDFKAVRTIDDTLISARIGYARALNENMQKEEAREELKAILEKKPTNKHA